MSREYSSEEASFRFAAEAPINPRTRLPPPCRPLSGDSSCSMSDRPDEVLEGGAEGDESGGSGVNFFEDGVPISHQQIHKAAAAAAAARRPVSRRRTPPPTGDNDTVDEVRGGVGADGRPRARRTMRRTYSPPLLPSMGPSCAHRRHCTVAVRIVMRFRLQPSVLFRSLPPLSPFLLPLYYFF